ncbi:26203_t:CDS:2 [Gigaspora margarita]|uniref:26203_t:CDS:1 n=1 Tax=Gigaspora margarita TaxID=4874 RepID=A0ABN7X5J7_GIGMA|nr:26203_t:CDS:2 [Gigaspora margarita]
MLSFNGSQDQSVILVVRNEDEHKASINHQALIKMNHNNKHPNIQYHSAIHYQEQNQQGDKGVGVQKWKD